MFSKISDLFEKPGFLHLIIIIILVWTLYCQIKTRYIRINYRTIFKLFISSAVAFQRSCFLMRIQDTDLSSFYSTIDREAIQSRVDAHRQNSLCGKPISLKTTQTFLKPSSKLYRVSWSLSETVKLCCWKIFEVHQLRLLLSM